MVLKIVAASSVLPFFRVAFSLQFHHFNTGGPDFVVQGPENNVFLVCKTRHVTGMGSAWILHDVLLTVLNGPSSPRYHQSLGV